MAPRLSKTLCQFAGAAPAVLGAAPMALDGRTLAVNAASKAKGGALRREGRAPMLVGGGPVVETLRGVASSGFTAEPRPGIVLHNVELPEYSDAGFLIGCDEVPGVERGADGKPPVLDGADMVRQTMLFVDGKRWKSHR